MSIEYDGYKPGTDFLTRLTNAIDRQQYAVSTVPKRKTLSGEHTYWEVAVLKSGFLGTFSRPLFLIGNIAADEDPRILNERMVGAKQQVPHGGQSY